MNLKLKLVATDEDSGAILWRTERSSVESLEEELGSLESFLRKHRIVGQLEKDFGDGDASDFLYQQQEDDKTLKEI